MVPGMARALAPYLHHVSLFSKDPPSAARFYKKLMRVPLVRKGSSWMSSNEALPTTGIEPFAEETSLHLGWVPSIDAKIAEARKKALEHGAQAEGEVEHASGVSTAFMRMPGGALFALTHGAVSDELPDEKLFHDFGEPPPFTGLLLLTEDPAQARAFFISVLGWTEHPLSPELMTLRTGGGARLVIAARQGAELGFVPLVLDPHRDFAKDVDALGGRRMSTFCGVTLYADPAGGRVATLTPELAKALLA